MFSLFGKNNKKPAPQAQGRIPPHLLEMRETRYSNSSLELTISHLADGSKNTFPWSNFIEANQALKKKDKAKAISLLKQIT